MATDAPLVVVDASIAIKWFVTDEDDADAAGKLLDDHAEGRILLAAPALIVHEVLNALRRRAGGDRPDLTEEMDAFFDAGVMLAPPDRELMLLAARIVAERCVSTYDAAYAALARTLDCRLVTADRRLAKALGRSVSVRTI